jgi:hypothetical protein
MHMYVCVRERVMEGARWFGGLGLSGLRKKALD